MSEITLECRGLSKNFGGVSAVKDVSAPFESGKVTALIGPNGAGKTTLFHLITGALRSDAGDVLHRGQSIRGLAPWKVARRGVGRLFQDVRVFSRLTTLENVQVAFRGQSGEEPLLALVAQIRIRRLEAANTAEALRWLELVNLSDQRDLLAETLSYGQQKLLAIARLLALGADILLLDEPTAGVHPVLVERLLDVIRHLAKEGRTAVVIEHNMNAVREVADWTYFMEGGHIASFGTPQEVLDDPKVRSAYLGLSTVTQK